MEIKVEKIGINGEGVSLLKNGKVAFINGALPSEIIDCDIVSDKKKYSICKLNNIKLKSDFRVNPKCKYFNICGGCQLQHIERNMQLDFKKDIIFNTIKKISKLDIDVKNIIRINDFYYRNKMVFPISFDGKKNIIGMFKNNSKNVVEIDECFLADNVINKVLYLSKNFFKNFKYKGFDFNKNIGVLKYLVVRSFNNQVLVTLVATKQIELKEYFDLLKNNFQNIGLSIIINDKNNSAILDGKYIFLFGLKYIEIDEFGIKYKINNLGFMQVNSEIKKLIYKNVLDNILVGDNVIDCYSGAGLMTAIVSLKSRNAIGIEINKSATESAVNMKNLNNLKNVNYILGDVSKHLSKCILNFDRVTIILDPPKSGCDNKVLDIINFYNAKIDKIIYISCNPATLSRDLNLLKSNFNITLCQPYEMFPQTKHIECFTILIHK